MKTKHFDEIFICSNGQFMESFRFPNYLIFMTELICNATHEKKISLPIKRNRYWNFKIKFNYGELGPNINYLIICSVTIWIRFFFIFIQFIRYVGCMMNGFLLYPCNRIDSSFPRNILFLVLSFKPNEM